MAAKGQRARSIRAALLAICASTAAAAAPLRVTDLLRALSATGVDILYSSDLVPPDLEAPATLRGADPLSRAVEALAAHKLLLRSEGQRHYLVTRAPAARPPTLPAAPNEAELDEVAVFGSRYTFIDTRSGESASFTHSDLEQAPGAQRDAMRAVRTAPGLATGLSSRPYIRGAFPNDVLVRFDGISLIDPFHFKDFQSLISAFDPAAVERVDVYTGGFPVSYGTRSAGVIDIAPRSVQSGYEHRVGASLLSYDLSSVGRGDSWPIDWLFTARHNTHNVALQPKNGDAGEPTYADAIGRVRWQASPVSALTLGWLLLDDRVQLSKDPSIEKADVHDRDVYTWLAADWAPVGALHSRTSIALSNIERRRFGSIGLPGVASGWINARRDFSTVELRSDWTYLQSAALLWNFGAAGTVEHADLGFSRQELFGAAIAADFGRPVDNSLTTQQAPRSSTQALYASGRRRWQELEVEVGARLDRQDYRGLGVHAQVSPRINLRFDATPAWHLYGFWGQFTQAQRVGEWRSEDNQSTPDPASHAVDLAAGVAHEISPATHWHLEAYRNRWSTVKAYFANTLNSLSLIPELAPDRVRLAPDSGETSGVELSVHRSLSSDFEVSGAYALSRTTDDFHGRDVLRSWDQTHAVNVDLAWRHAGTSASLVVGWHTGWPRTPVVLAQASPALPTYFTLAERNSARWGNYFTADLRVARTVSFRYSEVDLWVEGTNITNRANQCCNALAPADPTTNPLAARPASWFSRRIDAGFIWRFGSTR